jgi:hypothetical protein
MIRVENGLRDPQSQLGKLHQKLGFVANVNRDKSRFRWRKRTKESPLNANNLQKWLAGYCDSAIVMVRAADSRR